MAAALNREEVVKSWLLQRAESPESCEDHTVDGTETGITITAQSRVRVCGTRQVSLSLRGGGAVVVAALGSFTQRPGARLLCPWTLQFPVKTPNALVVLPVLLYSIIVCI